MKRFSWIFGLLLSLLLIASPAHAYGPFSPDGMMQEIGTPLTVHVDGKYVSTDVLPFIESNHTYLPIRAASEAMGADVSWDPQTDVVSITKPPAHIECAIGSHYFYINGHRQYSDVPPIIRDGRTMLPIRAIATALGGNVLWDGRTASVDIYTGAPVQPKPTLLNDFPSDVRWLVEKYYVAPTDYGIGSWYTTNQNNYYNSWECVFVSKMKNGIVNSIMLDVAVQAPYSHYMVNICSTDHLANEYILTPQYLSGYFYGPPMGFEGIDHYHYRYDNNNDLKLTGFSKEIGGDESFTYYDLQYSMIY